MKTLAIINRYNKIIFLENMLKNMDISNLYVKEEIGLIDLIKKKLKL